MRKLKLPELNNLQLKGVPQEAFEFYSQVIPDSFTNRAGFLELILPKAKDESTEQVEFNVEMLYRQEVSDVKLYDFDNQHSFVIECQNESELQDLFEKLSKDGNIIQYPTKIKNITSAWLKDKFNLTWELTSEEKV